MDISVILRQVNQHYILVALCYLHRAALNRACHACGSVFEPWPVRAAIIDIGRHFTA
ncbi:hypothetical protein CC77DRAFT_1015610 [Alternaria alternata]|uniref:Uncharacterized protein n=1 Tax=Alternaria alternata TaxID=5599 RepID=A0A177E5L7_ALTAL|nr:hypothetical protein CC77DRAFT_1015610 [Alternaria alternata]OAG26289.1 hypothetical protein CC77DRAFT_1015610 [Alternaria alternata]